MNVAIDSRPAWWSLTYSWALLFLPTLHYALAALTTRYWFADGAFHMKRGLITKRYEAVELYRIKTVSATDNVFAGGKIIIRYQDETVQVFRLVRNPHDVVAGIRAAVELEREAKSFKYRENF